MQNSVQIRPKGNSLLESILALFLLTVATLLVVTLFQTALQRSRLGEQEHTARLIAESTMTELRAWSNEGGFKAISDLASHDGRNFQDPEHNAYTVSISMKPETLYTFCSEFESAFPGNERTMSESCAKVEVTVTWSSGMGDRRVRLASLIPESPRTLGVVTISDTPTTPLNAGGFASLKAKAYDDNGTEIKDIYFVWWVEEQTGTGKIVPKRRTDEAVFTNRTSGGTPGVPRLCRVAALATYDGQEVIGYSPYISVLP